VPATHLPFADKSNPQEDAKAIKPSQTRFPSADKAIMSYLDIHCP
jgi:hypothetical protein